MLASQFLSVIIDEDVKECSGGCSSSTSDDDTTDDSILHNLERRCKLPQVLLAECTITIPSQEDKLRRSKRKCRFEAHVTPVRERVNHLEPVLRLQDLRKTSNEDSDFSSDQNVEDLLQGVEAVYSDEEVVGNSDSELDHLKNQTSCTVCKVASKSNGTSMCQKCSLLQRKVSKLNEAKDEYIPRGFQCNICGKVYSQRSVLKKHETIHSGYRLRCKVCGIDFTQRSSLLRHCKRIHGVASDSEITTPLAPPDPRTILSASNKAVGNLMPSKNAPVLVERLSSLRPTREDETPPTSMNILSQSKSGRMTYSIDPLAILSLIPNDVVHSNHID